LGSNGLGMLRENYRYLMKELLIANGKRACLVNPIEQRRSVDSADITNTSLDHQRFTQAVLEKKDLI